ncbi:uncharacterized protein N7459_000086 [Penicillium hispanicum]|uniref:uncharacterized protein n=1 Tax=Penicillium hispanicum TaxID=1080232 RepID=UPI0025407DF1|nr:uncharacterized protein N7459_000086 [Penicillium hispanicum]KAJ5593878.1 hypothetical protein N7459_000086 [Penicillium hispanicum]
MASDPLANPNRMPQILAPIEESRDLAADMRGFTLNPEQLKKHGYQLEEYMIYDLMRMRRCKRCRLRIRSKARKWRKAPEPEKPKVAPKKFEGPDLSTPMEDRPVWTRTFGPNDAVNPFATKENETDVDRAMTVAPDEEGEQVETVIDPWNDSEGGRNIKWPKMRKPKSYDTLLAETGKPRPVDRYGKPMTHHLFSCWTDPGTNGLGIRIEYIDDEVYEERIKDMRVVKRAVCESHPGLVRGGRFTCCNGRIFGPGCVSHDHHEDVYDLDQMRKEWALHETPPFSGVQREAIALDCEMGINRVGELELIRVSAVDFYTGEVLIDSLVWPSSLMLHLNTRFSGVNWNMLYRAKESENCIYGRDQARRRLWEFVGPLTIVITHGGSADMLALRWIHHRIIDTLELESRRVDPEPARSLKNLSQIHLNRPIQQTRFGHDSLEDAMASRDLVKWYVDNLPAEMKKAVEMPVSSKAWWTALVEPNERERLGVEMQKWLLVLGRIEV